MTITAKFANPPSKGHGLTQRLLAPIHHALANDQSLEDIVCLVVFRPVEQTGKKTKKSVTFDPIRVEVAQDQDAARQEITYSYTDRTTIPTIPMQFPGWKDPEQQKFLVDLVAEWAAEEGMTTGDVNEKWIGLFGPEANTTDYRKGSPTRLREFALHVKALADEPAEDGDEPDDEAADEPDLPEATT